MAKQTKYRVELVTDNGHWTPLSWFTKATKFQTAFGKPTEPNLAAFCTFHEEATFPGGVLAHLGITRILSAKIVDQGSDDVVAEFTRETPAFEVVA